MLSIIVFIFTNLGKREAWQLSAYSVFNPNFERLPVIVKFFSAIKNINFYL